VHRPTDARINRVELYFLPVATRVPLKFGGETLTTVTCARVRIQVIDRHGKAAEGWGETPLSVQWSWPSAESYAERHQAMMEFCQQLAEAWMQYENWGHPLEIGNAFQRDVLETLTDEFNEAAKRAGVCRIWRRSCAARRSISRCTMPTGRSTACRYTRRTMRSS
jgi:hypothetical protein